MLKIKAGLHCVFLLFIAVLAMYGCSGGGGGSTNSTVTWFASDGPVSASSQITAFYDSNQLYFNVPSTTNSSGEIRGELVPFTTGFLTDDGDPFVAIANSTPATFATILAGDQVRPRNVVTFAKGYGSVTINPATRQLTGFLIASGISGSSARINDGLSGSSGATVLILDGGPVIWTVPTGIFLTDQQIARLAVGAYYFDIQSAAFPDGEIRGQLNQQVRFASLKGTDEVPPVTTSATGTGFLAVNPSTFRFSGYVKMEGLSSAVTFVGVHIGAAGSNGGVTITLTNSGNGVYSVPPNTVLSSVQLTNFNNSELYFNIRTVNNAAGELRGQILKSNIRIGTAILSGAKEVPPTASKAIGTGLLAMNSVTGQVVGSVKTDGISGSTVQLHSGLINGNGPALISLSTTSPATVAPVPGHSFTLDIQPIFSANCTLNCHITGGVAPMSLEPGLAFANAFIRVTPGNSAASYLVDRLTGAIPPRMPLIRSLDAAGLDLVKGWIDKGALDN